MEEVKKRSKKENFYLMVYNLISNGRSPVDVCLDLNISKQKLQYYLTALKNKGYIKKLGYGTWEAKKEVKKFSLGTKDNKPVTNLHALQINFPILQGKIYDKDWQVKEKLNNWIPKYKEDLNLGGLTIKNNNNKSITVFAKARDIGSLEDVYNLTFKMKAYINDYFRKEGVILDVFNCQVKNIHLETEDKNAEGMLRNKADKFTLDLKKKSEKIFPKDNINAKAWIDGTPYKFSAGTNDLEWKRWYLSMPFMIRDSMEVLNSMSHKLAYVAENYKSHVKMVEQGTEVNKESLKLFKKINRRLDQKKLGEWL